MRGNYDRARQRQTPASLIAWLLATPPEQSNPRRHVDYRTDPIPTIPISQSLGKGPGPSHEKHLLGRFACAMQSVVRLVLQTVVSNERVKKTGCGEPVPVVFVIIAHVNAVTV